MFCSLYIERVAVCFLNTPRARLFIGRPAARKINPVSFSSLNKSEVLAIILASLLDAGVASGALIKSKGRAQRKNKDAVLAF